MPASSPPSRSATLRARGVARAYGAAPALVDVDLTVGPEDRVGVVGANGVGKTTLLRVLAGEDSPDSGSVAVSPPGATVGYLTQEHGTRDDETLSAQLARRTGIMRAEEDLGAAAAALASGAPGADDRYARALERYLALGVADFDARRAEVIAELGLDERLLAVPVAGLSGGQRAKAALASLLLSRFDLLLLDEPTNDLDFDGLARLEDFLDARRGGLVVVSHDRAFLERVVTSVLELDEASHRATQFAGGYRTYLELRATARRHAEEDYDRYVRARDRLKARERLQREWAVQGVRRERRSPRDHDVAQRRFRADRTEKQAAKVRITERALERLETAEKPYEGWRLELDLKAAPRSGDVVARLDGAVVARGDWRLGPLDLEVRFAERIAIVGPNGSGKTTLLDAVLGRVELEAGRRTLGRSVVVGEIGQRRDRFSTAPVPLVEEFLALSGLDVAAGRSALAKFGLEAADAERHGSTLSPGERTRAELALLTVAGTNCLVLDEPTNHLDLAAIEELESALAGWPGTLLLVTHDRRMLETVALTRRLSLRGGRLVEADVSHRVTGGVPRAPAPR